MRTGVTPHGPLTPTTTSSSKVGLLKNGLVRTLKLRTGARRRPNQSVSSLDTLEAGRIDEWTYSPNSPVTEGTSAETTVESERVHHDSSYTSQPPYNSGTTFDYPLSRTTSRLGSAGHTQTVSRDARASWDAQPSTAVPALHPSWQSWLQIFERPPPEHRLSADSNSWRLSDRGAARTSVAGPSTRKTVTSTLSRIDY